MSFYVI